MKKSILFLAMLTITSCQSMHSSDTDSLGFNIPKGSTLSLNKKLTIPHNETHSVIQNGKEIAKRDIKYYVTNCRLDVKKFGPRSIEPESFTVTRTEDGQHWISQGSAIMRYYTDIFLTSDKGTDIIKMVCQEYGDQTDYHFTVKEIETTLGDYFSFTFAEKTQKHK